MKLGIIGLDTSHCTAFTQILNDASAPGHVPGAQVVAAVKAFSPDMERSTSRVEEFTETMREKFGVRIVPTIEELCEEVDAVMIESLDGRAHLAQARPVIAAKKRLFIDKPVAASLRDVLEIFRLAAEAAVPVFSSSAYRFHQSLTKVRTADIGEVRAAISYGPAYLDAHHPGLFFYGVHPVEALYTVIGTGCESVTCAHTTDSDVVTGIWSGGRLGVVHGLRTGAIPHKVIAFGAAGFAEQQPEGEHLSQFGALGPTQSSGGDSYVPLVRQIMTFFQAGVSPVPAEETIEIFAFMEAAEESRKRGGLPVKLSEMLARARE